MQLSTVLLEHELNEAKMVTSLREQQFTLKLKPAKVIINVEISRNNTFACWITGDTTIWSASDNVISYIPLTLAKAIATHLWKVMPKELEESTVYSRAGVYDIYENHVIKHVIKPTVLIAKLYAEPVITRAQKLKIQQDIIDANFDDFLTPDIINMVLHN